MSTIPSYSTTKITMYAFKNRRINVYILEYIFAPYSYEWDSLKQCLLSINNHQLSCNENYETLLHISLHNLLTNIS